MELLRRDDPLRQAPRAAPPAPHQEPLLEVVALSVAARPHRSPSATPAVAGLGLAGLAAGVLPRTRGSPPRGRRTPPSMAPVARQRRGGGRPARRGAWPDDRPL